VTSAIMVLSPFPTPSVQTVATEQLVSCSTSTKDAVIAQLLVSPSISRASRVAGVSRTTIQRWMREDPSFAAALAVGRQSVIDDAVGGLKVAARAMIIELTRIALHGEREVDRVAAIRTALERVIPRKQEVTIHDESAQWGPILAVLPSDSAEYRALIALSERVLGQRIEAIPVTVDTTVAPAIPDDAQQINGLSVDGVDPGAIGATDGQTAE
jgi:hypothetical protein